MPLSPSVILDASKIFSVREVAREREIYDYFTSNNSPQALLRDLHRAVIKFGVNPLEFDRIELVADGGRTAVADMKTAIYADYRVPITTLLPTRDMFHASILERRSILHGRWADAPKFGKQYKSSTMSSW